MFSLAMRKSENKQGVMARIEPQRAIVAAPNGPAFEAPRWAVADKLRDNRTATLQAQMTPGVTLDGEIRILLTRDGYGW
jgi:hypothetical protein